MKLQEYNPPQSLQQQQLPQSEDEEEKERQSDFSELIMKSSQLTGSS